jgi:hypothetical protein
MDTVTYSGSCEAISDGHTTRIDLSANWSGRIECTGPIVVVTRGRRDWGSPEFLRHWFGGPSGGKRKSAERG